MVTIVIPETTYKEYSLEEMAQIIVDHYESTLGITLRNNATAISITSRRPWGFAHVIDIHGEYGSYDGSKYFGLRVPPFEHFALDPHLEALVDEIIKIITKGRVRK